MVNMNPMVFVVCMMSSLAVGALGTTVYHQMTTVTCPVAVAAPMPKCPEVKCPEMNCPNVTCPDLKCPDVKCPVAKEKPQPVETFRRGVVSEEGMGGPGY